MHKEKVGTRDVTEICRASLHRRKCSAPPALPGFLPNPCPLKDVTGFQFFLRFPWACARSWHRAWVPVEKVEYCFKHRTDRIGYRAIKMLWDVLRKARIAFHGCAAASHAKCNRCLCSLLCVCKGVWQGAGAREHSYWCLFSNLMCHCQSSKDSLKHACKHTTHAEESAYACIPRAIGPPDLHRLCAPQTPTCMVH